MVGYMRMKYQSTKSTESGWQACLHVAGNTCVKIKFLGKM